MNDPIWQSAMEWLTAAELNLPSAWPGELPDEDDEKFWMRVAELEMTSRDKISAMLHSLLNGKGVKGLSDLDAWMMRRRLEWAWQLVQMAEEQQATTDKSARGLLEWMLIVSWESDGCIGLWNHAERGGEPPEKIS